jgi:hypothetical protein
MVLPPPPFPSTATDPANDAERSNADKPSDSAVGTDASDPTSTGVLYNVGALANAGALHDSSTPHCQFQAKADVSGDTGALRYGEAASYTGVLSDGGELCTLVKR